MFNLKSAKTRALEAQVEEQQLVIDSLKSLNNILNLQYSCLQRKWSDLVKTINSRGGEAFLKHGVMSRNNFGSLTQKDITTIIKYCHPDKHAGSVEASEVTAKLLTIREQIRGKE